VVRDEVVAAAQAADRRRGDDVPPAALRAELPERRAEPEEDPGQVDADDLLEVGDGELLEGRERAGDPRVEVVEVDAAETPPPTRPPRTASAPSPRRCRWRRR
jgi:hypothetical protein